jgi:thiol-disulfide isomerase/thioredoxin
MALLVLLLGGGSLWAEDTVWERSCRFSTEVDGGKPRPGTVYERKGTPEMLGQLPDSTWFLLQPQERRVIQLAEGQVKLAADSPQATLSGQQGSNSAVRLTPSALTFDVTGKFVKVLPTPPLLGEVEAEDFLSLCPDYRDRVNSYTPDSKTVTRLSAAGGKRTVEVFFGSWCPHCQQVLPKLIKSLQLADNEKIDVKWIGLPRMFLNEPLVREREIKGVPTIIVLEDGQEVGRFSGVEKIPVEVSLANLVQPG